MNRGLWRLLIIVGLLAWFIFIVRFAGYATSP